MALSLLSIQSELSDITVISWVKMLGRLMWRYHIQYIKKTYSMRYKKIIQFIGGLRKKGVNASVWVKHAYLNLSPNSNVCSPAELCFVDYYGSGLIAVQFQGGLRQNQIHWLHLWLVMVQMAAVIAPHSIYRLLCCCRLAFARHQ